jgi:NTE family protein
MARTVAEDRPGGIGLALSGGAARGIAHVGVLEELVEAGIPVRAVAGTSAGSIAGALFAAGVPLPAMRRVALEVRWTDLLAFALPRAGLISGEGLERFLARLLPARGFAACRIPFAAVATDLATGERVDLVSGPLAQAVRASCGIPLLFEPARVRGRLLVDGGISSQVPVRAVRETLGVRPVVAVDVNAGGMGDGPLRTTAQVAFHLAMLWAARTAREELPLADAVIAVDARGIALNDIGKGPELLRRGREAARAKLPEIRALLARD